MHPIPDDRRRRSVRLAAVAVLSLLLSVSFSATPASAEVNGVELGLVPIGQPGPYFDVTMDPGETREFEVEVANHGSAAISARTYPADVYTIINGGFGGRLYGEAATGTTLWLDYETDQLALAVGDRLRRGFSITVPSDATPGEYISSLVLESEDPVTHSGGVAARQVLRQALGVVITVPGVRSPAIVIGEAAHLVVTGASVLSVALDNPGNVRLAPLVGVSLRDAAGEEVSEASVQMDTFYAVTDTTLEVPLDALLRPGTYTVIVALADADQGISMTETRTLVVEAAPSPAPAAGSVPGLTEVNEGDDGPVPWPALALIAAAPAAGLAWVLHARTRVQRRGTS